MCLVSDLVTFSGFFLCFTNICESWPLGSQETRENLFLSGCQKLHNFLKRSLPSLLTDLCNEILTRPFVLSQFKRSSCNRTVQSHLEWKGCVLNSTSQKLNLSCDISKGFLLAFYCYRHTSNLFAEVWTLYIFIEPGKGM